MRAEDRFLFLSARQALLPEHAARMRALAEGQGFDWQRVFTTAERGGIAPLVYRHITAQPELSARVPQKLLDHYRIYTARNTLVKKERARLLCQALQYFHERDIQVMLIKGAAQDLLVYDAPWITVTNDVDLVLSPRREELPERTVRRIYHHLHQKHVEFDFFEHHDVTMNGLLKVDFSAIWQDARPVDCGGEQALALSPEDHLISLCINSCRKRFFRLKSLLDIHEAIRKDQGFDWDRFAARCRRFECGNIAYTALLVVQRAVAPVIPERIFPALGVNAARAALIRATVWALFRFWSLSFAYSGGLARYFDGSIILPSVTYTLDQIRQKIRRIWSRRADAQKNITAQPIE